MSSLLFIREKTIDNNVWATSFSTDTSNTLLPLAFTHQLIQSVEQTELTGNRHVRKITFADAADRAAWIDFITNDASVKALWDEINAAYEAVGDPITTQIQLID